MVDIIEKNYSIQMNTLIRKLAIEYDKKSGKQDKKSLEIMTNTPLSSNLRMLFKHNN